MDMGVSMYSGDISRVTLDGEWDEDELKGDVYDECMKNLPGMVEKYKGRAVFDKNMWLPQYMASQICDEHDLIEVYNKEYDRHRNEGKFGIVHFDAWVLAEMKKLVSANLVGGKK